MTFRSVEFAAECGKMPFYTISAKTDENCRPCNMCAAAHNHNNNAWIYLFCLLYLCDVRPAIYSPMRHCFTCLYVCVHGHAFASVAYATVWNETRISHQAMWCTLMPINTIRNLLCWTILKTWIHDNFTTNVIWDCDYIVILSIQHILIFTTLTMQ